jgi:type I restriction enzyme S subunit
MRASGPALSEIAEVRISNVDKKKHPAEKPVKLCNYLDVYANDYVTSKLDFMEASASVAEIGHFGLQDGDVIITKDSETPDDIGVPAVVTESIPGLVCGYHLALVRPDIEQVDPIYLAKQLSTPSIARYFAQQATGSTRYGLSKASIDQTVVPMSPRPEQTKIAEVLSTIENVCEKTEQLIVKLRRIRDGLMQDLFIRGIDEGGRVRSDATHKFDDSIVGRIPKDWRVASVGELFDQRTERGRAGLPVMSVVMNDGLVARSSVDRRVESNLSADRHALAMEGDIVYNMMRMWQGVLGRAPFDCLISPAYVVLKPRRNIDTRFAEWLFRDTRSIIKFRISSRGVVDDRLRLYPRDLFSIKMALPKSTDEQSAISERLNSIKSYIENEQYLLRLYQRTRAGLMHDLLTGTKRVTVLLGQRDRKRVYA